MYKFNYLIEDNPLFYRCERQNCTAFVVDFARNICYSVQINGEELIPESNATFFHKICIKGKGIVLLYGVRVYNKCVLFKTYQILKDYE